MSRDTAPAVFKQVIACPRCRQPLGHRSARGIMLLGCKIILPRPVTAICPGCQFETRYFPKEKLRAG